MKYGHAKYNRFKMFPPSCRILRLIKISLLLNTFIIIMYFLYTNHLQAPVINCSYFNLSPYLQSSLNNPMEPHEEISLNFISELKNPCWYEKFNWEDLQLLLSNPYHISYANKKMNQNRGFKGVMRSVFNRYSQMLKANKTTRLRCIPYFYIIGQPKCASSDMYNTLNIHPQIRGGFVKESQWWAWTTHGIRNQSGKENENLTFNSFVPLELADFADLFSNVSIDWQQQLENQCHPNFSDNCKQQIISDGSIYTLDLAYIPIETGTRRGMVLVEPMNAPEYLNWLVPQAKLIVLVREPGNRLYSAYKYFRFKDKRMFPEKSGNITISTHDFHQEVVQYITLFNECIKEMSAFECRYTWPLRRGQDMLVTDSLYVIYMEEWIRIFGMENIIVIRTEDYQNERLKTLEKIFEFLDVCDPPPDIVEKLANETQQNEGRIDIGPMLPATRSLLNRFFNPYNQRLAKLLKDSKFLWKDVLET